VQAELPPGPDLEELFEAAQSAGKEHERIGQRRHLLLALVHRVHDAELGEAAMSDLEIEQVLGNDPDDRSAFLQRGIGDDAHQADIPAAVNQTPALRGEERSQLARGLTVRRVRAGTGPTEYADALMDSHRA